MWVSDKPIVDICHQINEISFELWMETIILMLMSVLNNDQLPADSPSGRTLHQHCRGQGSSLVQAFLSLKLKLFSCAI